jgi:hypothetical protein
MSKQEGSKNFAGRGLCPQISGFVCVGGIIQLKEKVSIFSFIEVARYIAVGVFRMTDRVFVLQQLRIQFQH